MKISIKGQEYNLIHTVKDEKGAYSLHLLKKEHTSGLFALSIFPDHYRLYPPLGDNSLLVTRAPLTDIVFAITENRVVNNK